MTQEELDTWYKEAVTYFPDSWTMREGYLNAIEDFAERGGYKNPRMGKGTMEDWAWKNSSSSK